MKTLILTLTIFLFSYNAFAQKANYKWSNENVKSISGTVYDNSRPTSYMLTEDGTYYKIHLGPIWFWNNNNYTIQTGFVKIKGNVKDENGIFNIYPFTIEQNGSTIILADDNGLPKWNKRGRGNNN
ncbi:MAG: hypothetical protein WAT71_15740 [Ignavibacteria bacterium]